MNWKSFSSFAGFLGQGFSLFKIKHNRSKIISKQSFNFSIKRTRILDFTPASLNMAASSKNATPRYSTLFISRTRATSTAPCPYASAFIIAIYLVI